MPVQPNVILEVEHNGDYRMVGKVMALTAHKSIFLHEERGNQWHRKLDSPGGIDDVVLTYLKRAGIKEIQHYSRDRKKLYIAPLVAFTRANTMAIEQTSDGRKRWYLPARYWRVEIHIPYTIPWITSTVKLTIQADPSVKKVALW